jgi:cytochrome c oxidase accessory protein FixG
MEVPKDRLATTDEFGDRVYIYPAEVRGFWRRHRTWTQWILIVLFLALPWLKINGSQAVLLSISKREFAFFGLTFFANDGPMIFFILAILTLGLALVTAIWGRIWCGWACPQTVFIDGVFRQIEKLIEGDHLHRRKLDQDSFSFKKGFKKALKWFLFSIVSTAIAHSFIAYFTGAEELLKMVSHPPAENWTDFLIVFGISGIILFDFGWFKEQFCFIMCPYGRFQSILMDDNSLAVMYDEKRGEPRKKPDIEKAKQGDCVNCSRCIMVCPTGIDIRRGVQMECINCTACIDACDEIMEKVKKPKGLIRYSSIAEMNENQKRSLLSFRSGLYALLIVCAFSTLIYKIITRESLHMELLRVKGAPYRILEGEEKGKIINQFNAHVRNQTNQLMTIRFAVERVNTTDESGVSSVELIQQNKEIQLKPGEIGNHLLFVKFPRTLTGGLGQANLKLKAEYQSEYPAAEEGKSNLGEVAPGSIEADMKLLAPLN